jgi:ATP-dependent RNA helicase RhlE
VVGGVAKGPQVRALRAGVDVLVATPGRLLDHLQHPYARLDRVEVLVLDEADRMLDMGFLPAIRQILERLPAKRQTLLFSATLPPPIVSFARTMLADPVRVDLQPRTSAAAGVRQAVYPVAHEDKTGLLLSLLGDATVGNALVFTRTKHRANRLAHALEQHGVACAPIHGNRTQAQRTRALSGFRTGLFRVLVATDVASRGIDVEKLSHVVNFDVPQSAEDYVHRIGRTARAQATGDAWTFVSPAEEGDLRGIERTLGGRIPRVQATGIAAPRREPGGPGAADGSSIAYRPRVSAPGAVHGRDAEHGRHERAGRRGPQRPGAGRRQGARRERRFDAAPRSL